MKGGSGVPKQRECRVNPRIPPPGLTRVMIRVQRLGLTLPRVAVVWDDRSHARGGGAPDLFKEKEVNEKAHPPPSISVSYSRLVV